MAGALTLLVVLLWAGVTSAHRRDEYLQAARLAIDPDRVQLTLDLTPGIAVTERVLGSIDRDASGSISEAEARAYAEDVLRAIALDVDGTPLRVELVDSAAPEIDAVMRGEGTMRIHGAAAIPRLADGLHRLRYRNNYGGDIGVYLANVLVPDSDRVMVTAQRRDAEQRALVVEYNLRGDPAARSRASVPVGLAGALVLIANLWWRRRPREAA